MTKPLCSAWRDALARLSQARGMSWTGGASTEAAWERVRLAEGALLDPAPTPTLLADKLHYLFAVMQPPAAPPLPPGEQPWRHRLLRSAIDDAAALQAAMDAAQAECRRLRRAAGVPAAGAGSTAVLSAQVAMARAEVQEALAERDAALDALARLNQHHLGARAAPPIAGARRH